MHNYIYIHIMCIPTVLGHQPLVPRFFQATRDPLWHQLDALLALVLECHSPTESSEAASLP
jgi:hypothetical protein